MSPPPLSSETIHASCVRVGTGAEGRGVLLAGRSGSGKSDLALRLIDRGAVLVSDDYTLLRRIEGRLVASAPANIAGRMEVRGLGILEMEAVGVGVADETPVVLLVDLEAEVVRMPPEGAIRSIAGVKLPMLALAAFEPSAPIKIELALKRLAARTGRG